MVTRWGQWFGPRGPGNQAGERRGAAELLKRVAQDPFEDDDGLFLVREAAGFHEE